MVFLYITCSSEEEAKKIGTALISKKAAGCVNYFPINSIYWGNNELKAVSEYVIIVKTIDSKVQAVDEITRENHSYQTPCIASFSSHRINHEYKEWLQKQVV